MDKQMLLGIINNSILLLGLVFVSSLFPVRKQKNNSYNKIFIAFILAFIGMYIMYSPFEIKEGIILDTRSILISMSVFFFGFMPGLIVVIATSATRIIIGGEGTITGLTVIASSGIIGLVFRKFYYNEIINNKKNRIFKLYIFGIVVHVAMLLLFFNLPIENKIDFIKTTSIYVLGIYPIVTVLYGLLVLIRRDNIKEKISYEELLYSKAYTDQLTGLYNRRHYEENLSLLDVKENYPLTIIMSDINGLKLINDAFGHTAGDELLIASASILEDFCVEKCILARIGGDEFVLVLPNTNETEAEKIITEIHNKAKFIKINSIPLSVSFGYKTKHKSSENIQEIYRSAEDAMYREKLIEIPSMRGGAIETILSTLYEKDENSEIHSRSVSRLSERLAKAYGLNRIDVMKVKTAGLLHDIGKIIIPVTILKKVGSLTKEEYDYMKTHSEIGFRILNSTAEMREISDIVLNHHERWDGKGYPRGIQVDKIPIESRIIAIADAYDAMTSERTYREIISEKEALKEILDNAGTQFDPELVKVFEYNFNEIIS